MSMKSFTRKGEINEKTKSLPAYILINRKDKNSSSKTVLGCVCYTHAKLLIYCFREAADLYGISMNDIHAYTCWDTNTLPNIPSESRWHRNHILTSDGKWESRKHGNVGTCKFCNDEFIFSNNHATPVCDNCNLKKKAEGCMVCHVQFDEDNVHRHFPIHEHDGEHRQQ